MAVLAEINTELVSLVKAALQEAGFPSVQVGTEWPSKHALENVALDLIPVISIYHKFTTYKPGNFTFQHSITTAPVTIVGEASDTFIGPGQSITLTISLAEGATGVNVGDAVSFILRNADEELAATYGARSGETVDSLATMLAEAISNSIPSFIAEATGADITITNQNDEGYHTASYCGSVTKLAETAKWAMRSVQLVTWCGDLESKFLVQAAVEALFARIDDEQGFALESGEWIQLKLNGAKPDDADTDKDVYTDHYLISLEHMVDKVSDLWAVVVPSSRMT